MRLAALASAAVLLSGCAGAQEADVDAAASAFAAALRDGDTAAACEALAPLTREELESAEQQPCAPALAAQELIEPVRVRSLERFGRQASVVVEAGDGAEDTWFLSRFGQRWLVVAAGCEPRGGDLPQACDVEGA